MANKLDLNDAIDFFRDVGFTVIIMDDDKPDIVERLRTFKVARGGAAIVMDEAANEIERLRVLIDDCRSVAYEAEIERLRAALERADRFIKFGFI